MNERDARRLAKSKGVKIQPTVYGLSGTGDYFTGKDTRSRLIRVGSQRVTRDTGCSSNRQWRVNGSIVGCLGGAIEAAVKLENQNNSESA